MQLIDLKWQKENINLFKIGIPGKRNITGEDIAKEILAENFSILKGRRYDPG